MRNVEPLPTRDCEAGYGPDLEVKLYKMCLRGQARKYTWICERKAHTILTKKVRKTVYQKYAVWMVMSKSCIIELRKTFVCILSLRNIQITIHIHLAFYFDVSTKGWKIAVNHIFCPLYINCKKSNFLFLLNLKKKCRGSTYTLVCINMCHHFVQKKKQTKTKTHTKKNKTKQTNQNKTKENKKQNNEQSKQQQQQQNMFYKKLFYNHLWDAKRINSSELAKMNKYIPHMSLPLSL